MIASLIKKLLRDRKAATAVALAIMTVPLLISASAAVDFSRIASARTLLQASVDSAALAGAGAWQMSEASTNANNVTLAAYAGTSAQLPNFVTPTGFSVALSCTGTTDAPGQTSNQCGTSAPFSKTLVAGCPVNTDGTPNYEYCVIVTASVTLKNSLFAHIIPSELLSATGIASEAYPSTTYTSPGKNPNFGKAYDYSGIYASAVPLNSSGVGYNFGASVSPNSDCSGVSGPLQYVGEVPAGNNVTNCNYVYLGDSNGDSGQGAITINQNQPVAFTFVNYTGDTTNYGAQNAYSDLDVTVGGVTTNYPNGFSTPYTPAVPGVTCGFRQANCTPSNGTAAIPSIVTYGECPQTNLYGAMSQDSHNPKETTLDSLNTYYSGYEVLGDPPTYDANHVLPGFKPGYAAETFKNAAKVTYSVVADNCPQSTFAPTIAANNAQTTSNNTNTNVNQDTNITSYATYYPGLTNSDGIGTDIYPPQLSACTPVVDSPATSATNASSATPNASTSTPWWGWSPSNTGSCTATGAQAAQYNNCALLVQPLGTNVPINSSGNAVLPDYYNMIKNSSGNIVALDPVYDDMTYIDPLTNESVTNTSAAGFYPTNTSPSSSSIGSTGLQGSGLFVGDTVVTERPAENSGGLYDHNPPAATSGQCYNPQVATQYNGYMLNGAEVYGYNANGTAIDPVANPQLGAVVCNPTSPASYALYWNDMGGVESDDLGYWNAIVLFQCPSEPGAQGGGAATLSG